MKEKTIRVSKSKACEISKKLIGTKRLDDQGEGGFYFSSGEVKLVVDSYCTYGRKTYFKKFDVDGARYEGPVYDCTVWVGDNIRENVFYTADGEMKEVYYEYRNDEG